MSMHSCAVDVPFYSTSGKFRLVLQSYMLLEATSFQAFPGSSFDRLQYAKTHTAKNWSQGRPNVRYEGFPLGGVPLYVHI